MHGQPPIWRTKTQKKELCWIYDHFPLLTMVSTPTLFQVSMIFEFNTSCLFFYSRQCSGCRKRRSLRTNSFFPAFPFFPRSALGTLLRVIFYFTHNDSQIRISRILNLNPKLVSHIFRRLQDLCSLDLQERPVIPFGAPGVVVRCDESKFNHKAKVLYNFASPLLSFFLLETLFVTVTLSYVYYK